MRPMRFFWGLLIAGIGLLYLGQNLGWWGGVVWERFWLLWPIILIALGLRMLIRNDGLFTALLIALLVASLVLFVQTDYFSGAKEVRMGHMSFGARLSGEEGTYQHAVDVSATDNLVVDLGGHYNLTFNGTDANVVAVHISGPKELIDGLSLTKNGNEARLADDETFKSWHMFSGDFNGIEGTIDVPRALETKLKLSGLTSIAGSNYDGKLTIDSSGATSITMDSGTVIDPSIDLSGAGKVSLANCKGTADIEISGAGKVSSANCVLDDLTIRMSGAGQVDMKPGSIKDLHVNSSGASQIKLPKPTGVNVQDNSGASNVNFY